VADLFNVWSFANFPTSGDWCLRAVGLIGNEANIRTLSTFIKSWPLMGGSARSMAALDVLVAHGSDVALMHLNGITRCRFRGIAERANEKLQNLADARGMTPDELADRLVPDLGLEEDGYLHLDFGNRQFVVGFDELLRPSVRDPAGNILKELPRVVKADDQEKAKEAVEVWKTLKKDVKTLATQQLSRLEQAMCAERRWEMSAFQAFLMGHPLLKNLVKRLIWGFWPEQETPSPAPQFCFRVAEDGSMADSSDNPLLLPEEGQVGIVHALILGEEEKSAFRQLFSDYQILQPFKQLDRETFVLSPEEALATQLDRWVGKTLPTVKLFGLDSRGWRRGMVEDGGVGTAYVRAIGGYEAYLSLDPGIFTGMIDEEPEQTLGSVTLHRVRSWNVAGVNFGSLPQVAVSELLRDLNWLAP
jgi:hypothetical protein